MASPCLLPLSLSLSLTMLTTCGKRRERGEDEEGRKGISKVLLLSIMEGSVISPLTAAIDAKGSSSVKRERAKLGRIESSSTTQRERERRGKMTEMFSALESMVPNVFPQAKRESIVGETIQYIQQLEEERRRLETLKKSQESTALRPASSQCTNGRNSVVNVTVSGNCVTFFGIQTTVNRRHLAVEIFGVFEKHGVEVLAASISSNGVGHQKGQLDLTVTAFVGGNGDRVEKIKSELLNL